MTKSQRRILKSDLSSFLWRATMFVWSGAVVWASLLLDVSDGAAQSPAKAANNEQEAAEHAPDNTGRNARDANEYRLTADDQSLAGSDLEALRRIRRAVVGMDGLSLYGKNIKIIVRDQTVTLRGPVKSQVERNDIEATVKAQAPRYAVLNDLEIITE